MKRAAVSVSVSVSCVPVRRAQVFLSSPCSHFTSLNQHWALRPCTNPVDRTHVQVITHTHEAAAQAHHVQANVAQDS